MQVDVYLIAKETREIRNFADLPIPGVEGSGAPDFDKSKTWNLLLRADDEARESLLDNQDHGGLQRWCDLVEMIRDDGRLEEVDPARCVFLTEAPMLGQYAAIDDDGNYIVDGCLWLYDKYQIKDPVEVLCGEGEVVLEFGGYFDDVKFPPLGSDEYNQQAHDNYRNSVPGLSS
jgi:hypothetical protein